MCSRGCLNVRVESVRVKSVGHVGEDFLTFVSIV